MHKQLLKNPPPPITDKIEPENWVLGANSKILGAELVPDGDWTPFLPEGEAQNENGVESYNCTGFGITNRLEILWKRIYGTERNFSDRAVGIMADTNPPGNSPHKVAEAVRHGGLLDEEYLPFDSSVKSVEQFYSPKPLPKELEEKAKEFLLMREPQHDYVATDPASLKEALKYSPLMVSVTAWFKDQDGLYYFPDGMPNNHDTTLVDIEDDGTWIIFDSYFMDGSFIKRLRKDCKFSLAKRHWFGPGIPEQISIYEKIVALLSKIVSIFVTLQEQPKNPKEPTILQPIENVPEVKIEPNRSRIEQWANAIKGEEGYFPGSRSYVNKNPGNMKWSMLTDSFGAEILGATKDDKGFAVYPTYEIGFNALCSFLTLAWKNELRDYKDKTLKEFTQIYAEPPANHPYAENVARKLKVVVDEKIKNIC